MLTLIAAAVLSPIMLISPDDPVRLSRSYKADEKMAFAFHAEMSANGMALVLDAEVHFKVKKTSDEGAEITLSQRNFKMTRDGSDVGASGPEDMVTQFDALGLPHAMSTENETWIFILTSLAGLVPNQAVEIDKGFDLKWEAKDKSFRIGGKGKLLETIDHEGTKAAKLEYELEVTPGNDESAQVKVKTLVGLDGTKPISAEGNVEIPNGSIKFSVRPLKN